MVVELVKLMILLELYVAPRLGSGALLQTLKLQPGLFGLN